MPWFLARAKSRGLRTGDGDVVEDVFVGSGGEGLARRTVSIDPQATRLQTDLIRIGMEGSRSSTFAAPPSEAPGRLQPTDLVDRAVEIGENVARRALRGHSGAASWLDVAPKGNTALWGPTFDAGGLYMGSGGIAVCLGALAKVTDSVEYLDLAVAAIPDASAVAEDDPDALATWEMSAGLSGNAYVSATVGHLTDQPELIGAATATMRRALPPELSPQESLDVVGGWSGVALAAVAVGERAGEEGVLQVARRLAHLIADSIADRSGDQWPKGFRRLGFAHGGTGIEYTIARVGSCLADARLLEVAYELVVAENAKAATRELPARIRPDSGAADTERGWCWGTGGFALARARLEPLIGSDANVHADVAKAHTVSGCEGNHRLCCGVAGQVDMLVEGDLDPTEIQPLIAALMVTDAELVLEPTLSFRGPSLFRGLSGVGYTLLRASDPTLPSVLAMD